MGRAASTLGLPWVTCALVPLAALLGCTEAPTVARDAATADVARDAVTADLARDDVAFDAPAPKDVAFDAPAPKDVAFDAPALKDVATPHRDANTGADGTMVEPTAPANRTCATATRVETSRILGEQPVHRGGEAACGASSRPALWYRVPVPAGHRVTATATDTSLRREGVAIALLQACGGACITPAIPALPTVSWTNEGADTEVFVAVSTTRETTDGNAQLAVGVQPPPTNATCAGASALRDGGYPYDEIARSSTPAPACLAQPAWRAVFYRGSIPPGQTLVVRGAPASMARQRYVLMSACDAATCLATSARTPGDAEALRYENTGAAPRDVVLAVAGPTDGPTHAASGDSAIGPPAANGACAAALRVSDGTTLDAERPLFARDAAPACASTGAETGALYYAVRVGPGEELVVNARVNSGTLRVRLLDRCDATACVAELSSGYAARLAWTNPDAVARERIVAVSLAGELQFDRVPLSFTVRAQPYAVTRIRATCDDMTGATPYTVGTSILGTTERRSVALPFAFPWFGEPLRHVTPSPMGVVELWPEATTVNGSVMETPAALPTIGLAPRALAPFWDAFGGGASRAITTRAVDGPRRHFTVQWSRVPLAGTTDPPLTFQAWLLDDGAVEFHYCALGTSDRATGATASIGAQGGPGPQGLSYAFMRAGAVATGDGLRIAR